MRDVYIYAVPEVHIQDFQIDATLTNNYTDGLLESIHTRKLPYHQNALQLPPRYTFYLHECTYDTYDRPIHQIYGNDYYSVNYAYDSVRS